MKSILTIFFCILCTSSFAQVYSGKNLMNNYFCDLKIFGDSSVYLIRHNGNNEGYNEYRGRLSKDSGKYKIAANLIFTTEWTEGSIDQNLSVVVGCNVMGPSKITVIYKDTAKKSFVLEANPDNEKNPRHCSYSKSIALDPKHYHENDSVGVDIGHKDIIWHKPVVFKTDAKWIGFDDSIVPGKIEKETCEIVFTDKEHLRLYIGSETDATSFDTFNLTQVSK